MTDTEMAEGVPTKIVMLVYLNGKMCVNIFRFSRLPKPKPKLSPNKQLVDRVYEILQPVSTDFVDDYIPVTSSQLHRRRTPALYKRPIEERVTLPPTPEIVYVPMPVVHYQRKGRGSGGRGRRQRNQGQKNNVLGVLNRGNFKNRSIDRRGRGRGKAIPAGHYPPMEKKSVSQLDRELEDYMKKAKHPKIIV